MAAYNDRVPLRDGTVLHTTDGKRFHILHSTAVGGSAILYSAHLDGSSLDVTLKEFYPAGCVRVNGVALDPVLAAPDASPALRQAFYQRLERMAQHELELSQLVYNGSFHALPHLEQLEVCSISQPEEPVHRSADGTALPCTFLYLPTLNPSKGFFLSDLLAECAAYPRDDEHPFGALTPDEPRSIAAPHVLTTLHLIRLILDALATLHKTALHGDISLGNLFIDGDLHTGTLRGAVFLDFGSARLLDAPNGKTAPIPPSEKLYTTPLFCAPEIFTGARSGEPFCLTPAADVYSVGVLLRLLLRKEALAAYRKFPEDLAEELKPTEIYPSDTVPSARPVLPQLNSILSAAAEPDPEKRISVAEMLKEISDLIEQLSAPRFPLAENLSSPETFIPHSRDNELKAIRKQMDSGVRPIFLYGLGGLGKTETARALLRQCKKDGMRVAFFNYEQSVRDTILHLEFTNYRYTPSTPHLSLQQQEEEHYYENLKLLAAMGQDSVVVMDNFDSSSQTFDDLRREPAYQDLIALGGPHLIITTRFIPEGDSSVEICPLPKELLLEMMLKELQITEKEDPRLASTLRELILAVHGHTLTCHLIAKSIRCSWGRLTAQDVLDALNQYDLQSLKQRPVTSDKDRSYTKDTIYGHLKVLFDLSQMTGAYRTVLCHTVLLPPKGLDTKLFLDGETPEGQDALIELVERGWIGRNRLNKDIYFLTTHSLIRQLILNELAPSVDECSAFFAQLERSFTDFVELLEETGYTVTPETIRADPYPKDPNYDFEYDLGCLYETAADLPFVPDAIKAAWLDKALDHYSESRWFYLNDDSDSVIYIEVICRRCRLKRLLLTQKLAPQDEQRDIWQRVHELKELRNAYVGTASREDQAKSFEKEAELETLFFSLSEEEALAGEHAEEYRTLGKNIYLSCVDRLVRQDPDRSFDQAFVRHVLDIAAEGEAFVLKHFDNDAEDFFSEICTYYSALCSTLRLNCLYYEAVNYYNRKHAAEWLRKDKYLEEKAKQTGKKLTCEDYWRFGNHARDYDQQLAFQYYMTAIALAEQILELGGTPPRDISTAYRFCAKILKQQGETEKAALFKKRAADSEKRDKAIQTALHKEFEAQQGKKKARKSSFYSANNPSDILS